MNCKNLAGANLTASWRLPCPSGANNILLLHRKTRVADLRRRGAGQVIIY